MNRYNKALHYFAVLVAFSTLLLIVAGGLVTSTQSGLSVPDWPNTYGHFMFAFPLDQMVGGIFYEHSHRMIASVVGFLTVILTVWLWKKEERSWVRVLGYAALGSVIIQGILGGVTVLMYLPIAVSVAHATLAQTFFALVSSIALFTSRWWHNEHPALAEQEKGISLAKLTFFSVAAIYIQLILGALMRHAEAGLAIPDFPFAYGQIFPSLTREAIEGYNKHLEELGYRIFADDQITAPQIFVHILHRYWGILTAGIVLWTAFRMRKLAKANKRLSSLSTMLIVLILIQITLGALTVISQKAVDVTTAHVGTGALLLIVSVLASLHTVRLFTYSKKATDIPATAKSVTA